MDAVESSKDWRELYKKALLERDPESLSLRICQAHKAIQTRTRELWYQGSPETRERESLIAATHYLQILRLLLAKRRHAA